jgi:hypothetical protein
VFEEARQAGELAPLDISPLKLFAAFGATSDNRVTPVRQGTGLVVAATGTCRSIDHGDLDPHAAPKLHTIAL